MELLICREIPYKAGSLKVGHGWYLETISASLIVFLLKMHHLVFSPLVLFVLDCFK